MNELINKVINDYDSNVPNTLFVNSKLASVKVDENIQIEEKVDKVGIDVFVKGDGIFYMPSLILDDNIEVSYYIDFYVSDNCNLEIIAGCAINSDLDSIHKSYHDFHIGKNCNITYTEKHYGDSLNNKIIVKVKMDIDESSNVTLDMKQFGSIGVSKKDYVINVADNAIINIKESIMSTSTNEVKSEYEIYLNGYNSKCDLISKSFVGGDSKNKFISKMIGNNKCYGRVVCDSIVSKNGRVKSIPEIECNNELAELHHEATVGRIAENQIIKLMTLGLSRNDAEKTILKGFLK